MGFIHTTNRVMAESTGDAMEASSLRTPCEVAALGLVG
jgi:hypothetical protein